MSADGVFWRGVIRRTNAGWPIYIHALRSTAEAFDPLRDAVSLHPNGGMGRLAVSPRVRGSRGGRRMQISRAVSKQSKVKGCVNEFRVSRDATLGDIALLAAATKGEWHWMTDHTGTRVDRSAWLARVI